MMFRRILIGVFVAVALAIASPPPTLQRLIRGGATAWEILHLRHEAGFPVGTLLPVAAVAAGVVDLVKKADEAQFAVAC